MKVEYIKDVEINHRLESTIVGFDNGWALSIGTKNLNFARSVKLFENAFDEDLAIKNIAFLNGQEIVAH